MRNQEESRWRAETKHGGGFVDWRPGQSLPRRWTTVLDGDSLPYLLELEFAADDGGPSCRAIRLLAREGGEAITARHLREIPVAVCIQVAITSAIRSRKQRPGEIVIQLGGGDPDVTAQMRMARATRGGSDERLREVADIYQGADENPTQTVQDEWPWPISYSTAARWVGQARQRGFLPPPTRGRTGPPARQED